MRTSNLRPSDDDRDVFGPGPAAPPAAKFERTIVRGARRDMPPLPPPPQHHLDHRPDPRTAAFARRMTGPMPECPLCRCPMAPLRMTLDSFDRAIMYTGAIVCLLIAVPAAISIPFQPGSALPASLLFGGAAWLCIRRARMTWAGDLCCSNPSCGHTLPRA